jgi:hypothetical protein
MQTNDLHRSLPVLFGELIHGVPGTGGFVLNPGDAGLLASLDRLTAAAASASSSGGATIAGHVAHVRYGIGLFNRWAAGENPFRDADWSQAWQTTRVSEDEWAALRQGLRDEAERWLAALGTSREISGIELDGVLASIIHLAYHLGAIRQIAAAARGPKAND